MKYIPYLDGRPTRKHFWYYTNQLKVCCTLPCSRLWGTLGLWWFEKAIFKIWMGAALTGTSAISNFPSWSHVGRMISESRYSCLGISKCEYLKLPINYVGIYIGKIILNSNLPVSRTYTSLGQNRDHSLSFGIRFGNQFAFR